MDCLLAVFSVLILLLVQVHYGHTAVAKTEELHHHRIRRDIATVREITPLNRTLCQPNEEVPIERVNTSVEVMKLRQVMKWSNTSLDAYLIVYEDEHINSPAPHDKRLQHISGFSGSNGYAWILGEAGGDKQALWTDGRYFLQADKQMDCHWILMKLMAGYPVASQWLMQQLPQQAKVGMDPKLVSIARWQSYGDALQDSSLELVPVEQDLVDLIWSEDRPPRPNEPLLIHTIEYTGVSWSDKIDRVREMMDEGQVLFLTALDDTAWLFNLRGYDRSTSPLFYSYALISHTFARLYLVNVAKLLTSEIQAHLNTDADGTCSSQPCVNVREYAIALQDLKDISDAASITSIWISPSSSYATFLAAGDKREVKASPIQLMKAVKNDVERRNYRACQIRDSAALVDFVSQLEEMVTSGEEISEIGAAEMLKRIRSEDDRFVMTSFDTISAVGANAAVIHYRPTPETDTLLNTEEVFLLDSGGQYFDGTTDVTRTFHFGKPSDLEIEAYTRVLVGVIELATTVWPEGWKGSDIDVRTRANLFEKGWDYNHGTGHGIGYFLNVHEGPGRINMGYNPDHASLQDGMYFSDEPGFYLDGLFGFRLETIVEVVIKDTEMRFNDKDYLGFHPVTLVPFEPKLIDYSMLTATHRRWLNEYNQRCRDETGQYLRQHGKMDAYKWLEVRTEHIPDVPTWGDSLPTDGTTAASIPVIHVLIIVMAHVLNSI